MSDLSIHSTCYCASGEDFRKEVGAYVVTYGPLPPGAAYEYGWRCTCPGFQYHRGKECKHIVATKPARCGWNEEMGLVETPADEKCPQCKGPLEYGRVGV